MFILSNNVFNFLVEIHIILLSSCGLLQGSLSVAIGIVMRNTGQVVMRYSGW
jgi:hypothetical protein